MFRTRLGEDGKLVLKDAALLLLLSGLRDGLVERLDGLLLCLLLGLVGGRLFGLLEEEVRLISLKKEIINSLPLSTFVPFQMYTSYDKVSSPENLVMK